MTGGNWMTPVFILLCLALIAVVRVLEVTS